MTTHSHQHTGTTMHHDEGHLADLLDLDAEILGSYLDTVTGWIEQHLPAAPRTIVDVGAGTGTGGLALARRFPAAEVVAVDRSDVMLQRAEAAAHEQGMAERMRIVRADLDSEWPAVGGVDLAWAASSLHEVADPSRLLRDIHAALNPGATLVVVEMDDLPRFLPDDVGLGRPGLEARCHAAVAELHWNAHPDWRAHIEGAGFEVVEQRAFAVEVNPAPPNTANYARGYLSRIRAALDGRLAADDLDVLDRILEQDSPDGLAHRGDLVVRGSRTAWAAQRR